jgi:hypothetical protein
MSAAVLLCVIVMSGFIATVSLLTTVGNWPDPTVGWIVNAAILFLPSAQMIAGGLLLGPGRRS